MLIANLNAYCQLLFCSRFMLIANFNAYCQLLFCSRFMLIANFGETAQDLLPVSQMYSDGEVVIDTTGSLAPDSPVKFKAMEPLPAAQALVIKLPK